MALYMIGLGLGDEKDITLKGLEAVKACKSVYLESYTSKLQCSVESLEKLYGKKIILADRQLVESRAEETILKDAKNADTAFLVIGDPFGATTHVDLYLRAKEKSIPVKIINNASVLNAIGATGLELYKFGRTVSIPFDENATSFYDSYKKNKSIGLHTLFLLDLSPKDNKYLTICQAIERLIKLGLPKTQVCIGCAALSSSKQQIAAGSLEKLKKHSFKEFPQCLIIPADMHFMEEDFVKQYMV